MSSRPAETTPRSADGAFYAYQANGALAGSEETEPLDAHLDDYWGKRKRIEDIDHLLVGRGRAGLAAPPWSPGARSRSAMGLQPSAGTVSPRLDAAWTLPSPRNPSEQRQRHGEKNGG